MNNKTFTLIQCLILCAALLVVVSFSQPKSAKGFRLPDGDVAKGRAAFVQLNCVRCHTVEGEQLSASTEKGPVQLALGGEVRQVKTYGQLVTSIINPNHAIHGAYKAQVTDAQGKSLMPDYTETMTVRQVIDLVAFLQAHYKIVAPEAGNFPYD
jgi:L-cysteine S-thiosulfotransferase